MKHLQIKRLFFNAKKLMEKIPDPRNAKEHYQSFIREKTQEIRKQPEIFTYEPKLLTPLILDQLLQNIQKLHINYPRL